MCPMSATANLRRQHDAAGLIVAEIQAKVAEMGATPTAGDAFRLTILLAKLVGTLRIHFAQEDRYLYPSLMASGRNETAAIARRFFDEMGELAPQLTAFVEKWRSPTEIAANWSAYRAEQQGVFAALADRIEGENEQLFSVADDLDAMPSGHTAV